MRRLRILLDIDGTFATWESVAAHGFGPGTRPYDQRVHALIAQHDVTLFSQNPEIAAWAGFLNCAYLRKPLPGSPTLALTGYDVLIDDSHELFSYHQPGIRCYASLDAFLAAEHDLT